MVRVDNLVQPLKQPAPMTEHPSLMVTFFKLVQSLNTFVPIVVIPAPITTVSRAVQPLNVSASLNREFSRSNVVTLSGITTSVNSSQPAKAR